MEAALLSVADRDPTADELIARANAMIPVMRERADACEQMRRIPAETIQDFKDAGFMRISQPKRFQGYDLGCDVITKVAMQIGRGCGSSAWMAGQWPCHQFMVSMYPIEAQEEYWATGPDTLSSTASAVARRNVEPERGGWRITDSQMRFSSGCDAAEWILFTLPTGSCLLPKADFEVLDDWQVLGLRGTGSKSIVVKDAWVPPHRFIPGDELRSGTTPGSKMYDNPFLHVPYVAVVNLGLIAAMTGMARGVLDIFEERVTKRFDLHTGKAASYGSGAQLRFAESSAEVDAAEMFIDFNCRTLIDWGNQGYVPSKQERALLRRNVTYAARMCLSATARLTSQGDASGMFDGQDLGRMGRNVQMAGLQAALTWDEPAQTYAKLRWGIEEGISLLT
ncbi:hypothetical protein [Sphingobium sp. Sx8-8]|uniref:hypothetical protein n=1 Tax=Sphingobium sp. Sx8-8 TaxID=2933617 RepID=UPI001F5AEEB7|nr:hypothetical protein [Sphingobium sp. Sx8-8]